MKSHIVFLTLSISFLAFVTTAYGRQLRLGSPAKTTTVDGFLDGYCSTLPAHLRVCKVLVSDDDESKFVIQKNGESLNEIAAPVWSTADSPPDGFVTYYGDLDGNGSAEVIVVSLDGVSNGMGVSYATANIFKNPIVHKMEKPIVFPIQEFGPRENFRYNPSTKSTDILVSFWRDFDSLDPNRITGVYLVGKWFRYSDGVLVPQYSRPTLARRFMNSFALQRSNLGFDDRRPYKWLQDKRTHRFVREPREISRKTSSFEGVLEDYTFEDGEASMVIRNGEMRQKVVCVQGYVTTPEVDTLYVSSLGLVSKRYTFPERFNLINSLRSLIGMTVRVDTYQDKYDNKFSRLWILD